MPRLVQCVVVKHEAEGLDEVPHPGDLGKRIFESVSKEGWKAWLDRLQMIINENQLSTYDPATIEVIEQHMLGFFFGEGDYGGLPEGFRTGGKKG